MIKFPTYWIVLGDRQPKIKVSAVLVFVLAQSPSELDQVLQLWLNSILWKEIVEMDFKTIEISFLQWDV